MRHTLLRLCTTSASVATLLLLQPPGAQAACSPASCDAVFDCGFRECVGLTCETVFEDAGTVCRSAAGVCDAAEACTGASLSCPSNKKKSAATVCRPSADPCDGAEHCDGASNDCPEDVGITPTIDRITVLDRELRFDEIVSPNRFYRIEIEGENLCTATVDSDRIDPIAQLGDGTPSSQISSNQVYVGGVPFPSETLSFDVNHGAAAGTLEFVAGTPEGYIDVVSPAPHAVVSGIPVFSIVNGCANCGVSRAVIVDDIEGDRIEETPDEFAPPLDTQVDLHIEDMVGMPPPIPEGFYVLEIEAIVGSRVAVESFSGDTSGITFSYLSGSSSWNRFSFTVPAPEPSGGASSWTAVAALAWCARRWAERARVRGPAGRDPSRER